MSPREASRAADKAGRVLVGSEATRLGVAVSSVTRPAPAPVIHVRLGSGIRLEQAELTPGVAATLRHAASMQNPVFYERQRMRASTWNVPRFLYSFDETIDGGLILPRGLIGTVASLADEAGSRLDIADYRSATPGLLRTTMICHRSSASSSFVLAATPLRALQQDTSRAATRPGSCEEDPRRTIRPARPTAAKPPGQTPTHS